jgi:hypothetical protein
LGQQWDERSLRVEEMNRYMRLNTDGMMIYGLSGTTKGHD